MEIVSTDRKAAEAVVDAAIISRWVNDGVKVSSETRAEWIETVMLDPNIIPELFASYDIKRW